MHRAASRAHPLRRPRPIARQRTEKRTMIDNSVHALGPLFGPDFVTIEINDQTGMKYALAIQIDRSADTA